MSSVQPASLTWAGSLSHQWYGSIVALAIYDSTVQGLCVLLLNVFVSDRGLRASLTKAGSCLTTYIS